MGSVNVRTGSGLYLDFRYQGKRCREQTLLPDTPVNRVKLNKLLTQIEADIKLGTFVYASYFPDSKRAYLFKRADADAQERKRAMFGDYERSIRELRGHTSVPFDEFSNEWYEENRGRWKYSYCEKIQLVLNAYLIPAFADINIDQITRSDILKFRASIMKPRHNGKILSNDFINHVMTPLRMILAEGADRYGFRLAFENIKQLSIPRYDVNPFSLAEVFQFLDTVRPDFRLYYLVRFFTGMRTGEIDGLRWEYVDFEFNKIYVRKSWVRGREETTKTSGSSRDIDMSTKVRAALLEQYKLTGQGDYVFTNRAGKPLDKKNVRERVWIPTLEMMGIKYRRPYETRHTAATLWLAAGESPEWIARQMGHTTTKMLFETYSRYVPNLTRKDGSAFERLVAEFEN